MWHRDFDSETIESYVEKTPGDCLNVFNEWETVFECVIEKEQLRERNTERETQRFETTRHEQWDAKWEYRCEIGLTKIPGKNTTTSGRDTVFGGPKIRRCRLRAGQTIKKPLQSLGAAEEWIWSFQRQRGRRQKTSPAEDWAWRGRLRMILFAFRMILFLIPLALASLYSLFPILLQLLFFLTTRSKSLAWSKRTTGTQNIESCFFPEILRRAIYTSARIQCGGEHTLAERADTLAESKIGKIDKNSTKSQKSPQISKNPPKEQHTLARGYSVVVNIH